MIDEVRAAALYLYCVVPVADAIPAPLSSPALDGGAVHAVRYRDLAALAHACPPEPYQGDEEKVRAWVAAHNTVVEEAWQSAESVLPMSFDVIVTGDADRSAEANLVGWLGEHHGALRSRLQALEGRAEVGVQILWSTDGTTASEPIAVEAPALPARGRAYFARQQLRRQLREQLERKAEADCRRYFENLAALADDVQVGKPRPVKGGQMVLNLSLLVARLAIAPIGEYLEMVSQEPGVEANLVGWLGEHHAALRSRLQALEGRAEVGVQVLWDTDSLTASEAIAAEAPAIPARGRAYFARQQLRRQVREQLERKAGPTAAATSRISPRWRTTCKSVSRDRRRGGRWCSTSRCSSPHVRSPPSGNISKG